MTYSAFILKILHIGFVNHYQTAVFWVPGERRCYKEKAEKALKSAGWVQDNMDVRAEATKAVLCSTLRVESLCWQPHIDPHCVCGSSMEPGVHLHPHKVTWIPPDVSAQPEGSRLSFKRSFENGAIAGYDTSVIQHRYERLFSQGTRSPPHIVLCC